MFIMVNVGDWIADLLIGRTGKTSPVRKAFQVTGFIGAACFLVFARDAASAFLAALVLSLAMGMLGLCYSGFGPNHLEIAPRHADVLFEFTNTFAIIPGVIGVAVTGWLVDVSGTYASAFLLAAFIYCLGAVIWLAYSALPSPCIVRNASHQFQFFPLIIFGHFISVPDGRESTLGADCKLINVNILTCLVNSSKK